MTKCIAALGVPSGKRHNIRDTVSKTALSDSYVIWLCRLNKAFQQIGLIQSWEPSPTEDKEDVPAQDTQS